THTQTLEAPPAFSEMKPEHASPAPGPLPLAERAVTLAVILLPVVGLVAAVVYAWGWGVGWTEVALMLGMYIATGLGITVGFHRLFTHCSFTTGPVVTAVFGVLGSMAFEGPLLRWVAYHRCHHQHSDNDQDPHSPHHHGTGVVGVLRGFFNAHMGWMLLRSQHESNLDRYIKDFKKNRLVTWISGAFPLWSAVSLLFPALIGGLISMSWTGVLLGFLWGGLVRILVVHHITWSVNSVCHLWGTRPYEAHDESRNNPIVGVLAFGEGWHNNHHAFPTSARHGLAWWQFDTSYIVIRVLALLGMADNIRLPKPERVLARRRSPRTRATQHHT
ncbi:MAG: fatty acid desaturase, partial [Phycisphaerales bacterium]|nr:fatty acid desaturase [Phycisphaerales bacterium]